MAAKKKAAVHPDSVDRKRYTAKLPVAVGAEQRNAAAHEMARIHHLQEELKSKRREANAGFRAKQNELDGRMGELADTVDHSTELRDVEVVERLLPTGEIEKVRMDTLEVLETRTASAEDRQDVLPGLEDSDEPEEDLPGPKSKAAKAKAN